MKSETIRTLANAVTSIVAIGGVTFLGYHGVVDAMVIGAIAGLGGYAMYKHRSAAQ